MQCRTSCGACCIAPSISTPIPGMPEGKPAGVRCVQLSDDNRCKIFTEPMRPAVCCSLKPSPDLCGNNYNEAMLFIERLEIQTNN